MNVGLSLLEGIAIGIGFGRAGYIRIWGWVPGQITFGKQLLYIIFIAIVLTAGSALLMWMGERITLRGVGNGISIVVNIISRLPHDFYSLYEKFMKGKTVPYAVLAAVIIASCYTFHGCICSYTTSCSKSLFNIQRRWLVEEPLEDNLLTYL